MGKEISCRSLVTILEVIENRKLPQATWLNVVSTIILSLFVFQFNLSAQKKNTTHTSFPKPKFEHLSIEQGLSVSTVTSIVQDVRGFMWFGTEDGLNKYDGYSFAVYKQDPQDLQSLSGNNVSSIYEDQSGILWIGTVGSGLNKFDREKEIFTQYKHNHNGLKSLSDNRVSSIYEDQSGVLWIGTDGGGLNKFDREKESFTRYKNDPNDTQSLSNNRVLSIYEDRTGVLWIGTFGGGLNKLVPNDNEDSPPTFVNYKYDPNDSQSLSNNKVSSIYEDRSGVLWIGTFGGGLNKLIPSDNEESPPTFIHYKNDPNDHQSLSNNKVSSIYEDQSGVLWIGTRGGGLNKLVPSDYEESPPTFIHYKNDPNDPQSLSGNVVFSIYEDQSGVLWIGTDGNGLNKFDLEKDTFIHYKQNPNDPQSLSANQIFSICEDQSGVIWIAAYGGGLNKFVPSDNEKSPATFVNYKQDLNDPQSLSNNGVFSIYEDKSGVLWIGTDGGGLNKLVRSDNEESPPTFINYKQDPNDPQSLSANIVTEIYEDKSGVLWIGTFGGGLNKLVPGENEKSPPTFINYKYDPNDPQSLSGNAVLSIYEDKSGVLWIGTSSGGLNKLVPSDNEESPPTFVQYKHNPNDPQSLSGNAVLSIYEDKSGVLWIGTGSSGLNKFDRGTGTFQQYREKDGLPNDVIYGILEDDNRNLWLSTNQGLSKFNLRTKKFRNYDIKDGLQSNEFNSNAYLKSKDGNMFFGGINGFNIFHPDSIKDNAYIPPIVFTDFQIFNKSVSIFKGNSFEERPDTLSLDKHISEIDELILSHQESVFSFEFAALDFHNPEKNKYAYKMEGVDPDWVYTDANRRFATYTKLDPGSYVFTVKGTNNDGIWNEKGKSILVIVTPPWWQTTWAYLIYALILLSIIYFTWQMQLKRIRIKHDYEMSKFESEKMHEVDEMKSRFFSNISHEFRTPLTLIFGPAKDIMENCVDNKARQNAGLIKRNANRLYGLVNQLMDLSKLEAGKMTLEAREQNIIPVLNGLVLSFTSLAKRKKITLKFNSSEEKIIVYIDRDKIEEIINNILSNALKFTAEGGEVVVSVSKPTLFIPLPGGDLGVGPIGKAVKISIRDTGVGIPPERIDKIFDRFYQVDCCHAREQEGTGLGLALTKELVELHKGEISVESEEGKGTTFTVRLPLGKEHLKPEEIFEADNEKDERKEKGISLSEEVIYESVIKDEKTDIGILTETSKPLLLIVDDDSDVRNYIKGFLDKECRILEAADGEDGLCKSIEHIPDLIVSDVMMPKINGFQLCEKLKTDERTSHIPVILLTAKAASKDKIEGYETGADDYIMKPFDAKELKVRIKNLIEQRKKLQEHFKKEGLLDIEKTNITPVDKIFLQRTVEVINKNLSDTLFGVESFANEVALSRVTLHRKLVALTGEPPGELIKRIRLCKAAKLIENKTGNISEIALEVGFNNPAYFSECFKKQFGVPPSQYQRNFTNH